ncbi:uncharacterized protein [Argopecten irradians]|uniref:uncharacterized protein n=1 Tax=Argopecten irradians TaxID=31199 RepID=UPI0037130F27
MSELQQQRYWFRGTPQPPISNTDDEDVQQLPLVAEQRISEEIDKYSGMAGIGHGIQLGKFSGSKGEDPRTFFNRFKNFLAFTQVKDEQKAPLFALSLELDSSAFRWYDGLQDTVKNDMAQLETAFLDRFDSKPFSRWSNVRDINSMSQGARQPVLDFVHNVRYKAKIAKMSDTQIFDIILGGLKKEIRSSVIQKEPQNLDDLIKVAELAEVALVENFNQETSVQDSTASPSSLLLVLDKIESLASDVKSMRTEVNVIKSNGQTHSQSFTPHHSRHRQNHSQQHTRHRPHAHKTQPTNTQSHVCSRCGSLNHSKAIECPAFVNKAKCNSCDRIGHYAKMCRQKNKFPQVILGMDFLGKYKGTVNVGDNKMSIFVGSAVVECKTHSMFSVGVARVCTSVTVQPQQQVLIPVKLSRIPDGSVALLEPDPNLYESHKLVGGKTLVSSQDGKSVCMLLNPNNIPIQLTAGTIVGKLLPIDEDSVSALQDDAEAAPVHQNSGKDETRVYNISKEDSAKLIETAKSLGIPLEDADLTESQKARLLQFIGKNRDVFAVSLQELGCTDVHHHRIETGDALPHRQRFYRHSPLIKTEVERQVTEMLENDVIEPSVSTWNSPVVMVRKRTGEYRFAVDYRGLNAKTLPVSFPLPRLEDVFDSVDASGTALGWVLGQLDDQGRERAIAYGGRALRGNELKFGVSEKECLALVEAVQAYHPYLANRHFNVYTDNLALKYLKTIKDKQVLEVSAPAPDDDLALDLDEIQPSCTLEINQIKTKELINHQRNDDCFKPIVDYKLSEVLPDDKNKAKSIVAQSHSFEIDHQGVLYHIWNQRTRGIKGPVRFVKRLAVPKQYRQNIMQAFHDSHAGGVHMGINRTHGALKLRYYWPSMVLGVETYIQSCIVCQTCKRNYNAGKVPLTPLPVAGKFERWHMDILGPLPASKERYTYILLVVDSFSHWCEAHPLRSQESSEIAKVLYKEIFTRYGCPSVLVSDRGKKFMGKLISALCEFFDVGRSHTSSYHPMSNSVVERTNSTLAANLRACCDGDQTSWPDKLPGIMMAYRMTPSTESTEFSPFYIAFGMEMRMTVDTELIPKDSVGRNQKQVLQEIVENAKLSVKIGKHNIELAKVKQKQYHDQKAKEPNFQVGDTVLLSDPHIKQGESSKLHKKYKGPYRIERLGPNYTYKLRNTETGKLVDSLVNAARIKHFKDMDHKFRSNYDVQTQQDPPPVDPVPPLVDPNPPSVDPNPPSVDPDPPSVDPDPTTVAPDPTIDNSTGVELDQEYRNLGLSGKAILVQSGFHVQMLGQKLLRNIIKRTLNMVVGNERENRHFLDVKPIRMGALMLFWVLSSAMATLGNVEALPYDRVKELFNYGVIFKEKGTVYPTANHWEHFFELQLETFPYVSERPSPCINCPWYDDVVKEIVELHRQTAMDIGTIIGKIKNLLPHHSSARIPISRKRRSFLPFIGSIAKTLFGSATTADVTNLSKNVAMIRAKQQQMIESTSHQIDTFTAAIRNFDSRITNGFQGITDNHNAIEKLGQDFNTSLVSSQVAQAKLLAAMTKQTRLTLRILTRFEELLMGILSTMQGKLSPLLIPHNTLSDVLLYITENVARHGFHLTHSHPTFYYRNAKFTIFRRFSNILISVQFPITTLKLKLYQVHSFPIPLNHTSRHATQLGNVNDYVLLSPDEQLFREINSKDLESCSESNHIWHCDKQIVLRNDTGNSCLLSLFHGNKSSINKNCIFHFVQDTILPSLIQLNSSHFVMINITEITLMCEDKTYVEKGCSFCIISIPCKCSLSSKSLYLPPHWNGCDKTLHSGISKLHGINLILLQQFFNSSLRDIEPNSTFSSMLDVQLPHIHLFTHNFTNIATSERKAHLNLRKVAQAAKDNKMVFQKLSESMLDYQTKLPSDLDFGTIFSFISFGLAIICFLAFVFLFSRYRILATTVTLLSQTRTSQAAILPVFHYTTYSPLTTTTVSLDLTPHLYSISEVLATVSFLILLVYVIYRCVRKERFQLVVELTNTHDTVLIPILNLPYDHDSLIFTSSSPPKDFRVTYGIRSFLNINWSDFSIKDKTFEQTFKIQSDIYLHPILAYRTNRIISTTFTALLYRRLGRVMYPVDVTVNSSKLQASEIKLYPDLSR